MKANAKLTKLERENLLTNAELASCIGYWIGECEEIKYSPRNLDNYRVLSITAKLGEDAPEPNKVVIINHKTIQKGIDILFTLDGYDGIKSSIIEDDADIETTDVVIQLGVFGEVVYG